jgi:hypothetical protein
MSAAQRAVLTADIVDGRAVKAVAALTDTSAAYVHSALKLTAEQRGEVYRGVRPLVSPRTRTAARATGWDAIGDDALVEAFHLSVNRMAQAAAAAEAAATTCTS